ncbi:LysR family transcriptional regulator [Sphingomonas sp. GC_Shp_6]|uniref:LysR family transcriptional regulator n=2 Tax=unclassified Sphingomonas TaxID=196159 RepID=UPI002269F75B|nr:LysR family transcriptional regulator [Sphingomonas sp. GC_Shp_6]
MGKGLRAIDLNLVPVLRALLQERSVTRAASRVGLSQPAASNALARLRTMFSDPLLIKDGRAMVRTPFAERLLPLLELACDDLEQALLAKAWSPERTSRRFVVVMADHLALKVVAPLRTALARDAPNITVRFGAMGAKLHEELRQGRIDIAYVSYSPALDDIIEVERVSRSKLVAVVGPDHPFAARPPRSRAEFLAAPRFGMRIPRALVGEEQETLVTLLGSSNMAMEAGVAQFSVLPGLALATGCLTVTPLAIASVAVDTLGMRIVEIPETEEYFELCAFWNSRYRLDPGHQWFRKLMTGLVRDAFDPA